MEVVKTAVAVTMVEVGLVLLGLEEGISGENGREMADVEMGGRNVPVHSGFVPIKCIVIGPKV